MAYKSKASLTFERSDHVQPNKKNDFGSINGGEYDTIEYPPKELGSNRYPHFTVFFINENDRSVLISKERGEYSKVKNKVDLTKKTAGLGMGSFLAKNSNAVENFISNINETLGDLVDWTASRKRMKKAICLPMPQKIRANYSAAYQATNDMGAYGAVIGAALNGSDIGDSLALAIAPSVVNAATENLKSLIAKVPRVGASLSNAIKPIEESTVKQILSKMSGKVLNKRQEQLFNNMEFRAHQFSYLFVPRNKKESEQINSIIKTFKYYMHPELNDGSGSSILITPAEFDIEFRFKDKENSSISRIATCALKDMDVNYTAIGEFVAFDGVDHPVAISMDLTFVEIEPLTREMIRLGM